MAAENMMVSIESGVKGQLLSMIRDGLKESEDDDHDVIIVCEDDQLVRSHRKLLGMMSPMLRNLFGSLWTLDVCLLSLPDFSVPTVEGLLEMLSLNWSEEVFTLTEDQVDLLTCLNIQPWETWEEEEKLEPKEVFDETAFSAELSVAMDESVHDDAAKPPAQSTEIIVNCPVCDALVGDVERHMKEYHTDNFPNITLSLTTNEDTKPVATPYEFPTEDSKASVTPYEFPTPHTSSPSIRLASHPDNAKSVLTTRSFPPGLQVIPEVPKTADPIQQTIKIPEVSKPSNPIKSTRGIPVISKSSKQTPRRRTSVKKKALAYPNRSGPKQKDLKQGSKNFNPAIKLPAVPVSKVLGGTVKPNPKSRSISTASKMSSVSKPQTTANAKINPVPNPGTLFPQSIPQNISITKLPPSNPNTTDTPGKSAAPLSSPSSAPPAANTRAQSKVKQTPAGVQQTLSSVRVSSRNSKPRPPGPPGPNLPPVKQKQKFATQSIKNLMPQSVSNANCLKCAFKVCGNVLEIRDKMRNHIGSIHFANQLLAERKRLFQNNVCSVCKKQFKDVSGQTRHLMYNHSNYVQEITAETEKTIQEVVKLSNTDAKTKFQCTQCTQKWEFAQNDAGILHKLTSHMITHFAKDFTVAKQKYFDFDACVVCNVKYDKVKQRTHLLKKHNVKKAEIQTLLKSVLSNPTEK